MSLDLGIPPLVLQQAKQLCQMHFRYTYGAPSIMPARLYALRVTHMMASSKDCMEHRIQRAYTALDMGALYPSLAPLPLSVSGNATRHKEKAYGRVLKTRVSEVWRQTVLRDSPRVTDIGPPQGRRTTISLGICSPQHPICVASRPIRHTIFSGFALKIRTSFRHRNPDPTECPKHNTGIGGAHFAQVGTWAVKLTCISHAQSRHRWHIHSS